MSDDQQPESLEQQARALLARAGVLGAQTLPAGNLTELATLLAAAGKSAPPPPPKVRLRLEVWWWPVDAEPALVGMLRDAFQRDEPVELMARTRTGGSVLAPCRIEAVERDPDTTAFDLIWAPAP